MAPGNLFLDGAKMLQTIRERFTGPIAFAVIGAIAVTLVISFGNMDTTGGVGAFAAEVNGEEIPTINYQRVLQNQLVRQQEIFRGELPPAMQEQLERNVLESMVRSRVAAQFASDSGYGVSEPRLKGYIQSLPVFQVGGEYSYESYVAVLSSQGLSPAGFESEQRSSLQVGQLEGGIISSAFFTPAEYRRYIELLAEQRTAVYVKFDPASLAGEVDVTAETMQAYYDANPGQFETEESVDLEYVEISLDDIMQSIVIDEAAIRDFYDENPDRYQSQEQRQAKHILVAVSGDRDQAAAEQLISELAARLDSGEEFGALAAEYSDDPVSGNAGGDLGWAGPGDYVPAFEEVLFSLQEGQTSDAVRTQFGFHLIQLVAIRSGEQQTFAKVRDELFDELREREAAEQFYALAERVDDLALENSSSLAPVASESGLDLKRIESFTRAGGGSFGYNQSMVDAAFSIEVLEDGENSPLIEISDRAAVVLRVSEHRPVRLKTLDQVKPQLEESVRLELAADKALTRGEDVLAQLKGGESIDDLAVEFGFQLESPEPLSRGSDTVDPELLGAIFRAPKPVGEQSVYQGVPLGNGGYAVFNLRGVRPGLPEAIPQDQRDARKRNLAEQQGRAAAAALVTDLRESANVYIVPGLFDQPDSL
jgi:peptidyl-prolyl cis-trans isomerase D